MRRWRPLLFALGLALTLALALHVTDFALTLWQRLSEASPLFLALYGLLIALVAWLVLRLMRPRRPVAAAAPPPPDAPQIDRQLEAALQAGLPVERYRAELAELERRRAGGRVIVACFGEVSAGKSSLIRALLPGAEVVVSPVGGSTRTIVHHVWTSPAGDELVLADVPGLNEADGTLDAEAEGEAVRAHAVIYVTGGDLARAELAALERLLSLGKPLLVALNKADRYTAAELALVQARIRERLAGRAELVAVSAGGTEEVVRIGADGSETRIERERPADVHALGVALQRTLDADAGALESLRDAAVFTLIGRELDAALAAERAARAETVVETYARKAVFGALAAVGPGTDVLIQGWLGMQMLKELSAVYGVPAQEIDLKRFLDLASRHVGRRMNLLLALAGNVLKAFPGVGTVLGGALHAIAYGLIFESLGHAAARSLASRGALVPGVAVHLFEDALGEHLETRARRLAALVVGRARSAEPGRDADRSDA